MAVLAVNFGTSRKSHVAAPTFHVYSAMVGFLDACNQLTCIFSDHWRAPLPYWSSECSFEANSSKDHVGLKRTPEFYSPIGSTFNQALTVCFYITLLYLCLRDSSCVRRSIRWGRSTVRLEILLCALESQMSALCLLYSIIYYYLLLSQMKGLHCHE